MGLHSVGFKPIEKCLECFGLVLMTAWLRGEHTVLLLALVECISLHGSMRSATFREPSLYMRSPSRNVSELFFLSLRSMHLSSQDGPSQLD